MSGDALLPWYVTIPSGVFVMALLMSHLTALARVEGMDTTRQRIRQANGVIMMLLVPIMIAGLSVIDPARAPAAWVIAWTACVFLVLSMVAMAFLDALNTVRIARERRAELRNWLLGKREQRDD